MTAASVAATAGCSPASAAARASACGTREREAAPVDEAEPVLVGASAVSSASTPSGVFGPASRIVERVGEAGAQVGAGGKFDQPVDRLDAELVVDELDDERHDRVGAADRLVPRPAARCGS